MDLFSDGVMVGTGTVISPALGLLLAASAPAFILMQLLGGALGLAAVLVLYPRAHELADDLTRLDRASGAATTGDSR